SIGSTPASVSRENEHDVWLKLYGYDKPAKPEFKFELGDKVRISKNKLTFEKGYIPNWTEEIFIVHKRRKTPLPTYKLRDWNDEEIQGSFYEAELQKVTKSDDDIFKIEKVIRKRKRGGKTEFFVKWLGYPAKFNSWVERLEG
ncbi:uncharacterized protein LOC117121113, partial [Anneissia japonica]|uniref:uncharacterized protein LOC117121113 n=1 Tax=Anneissia japonica TaxID=1529436 RepID=UPI00142590C7